MIEVNIEENKLIAERKQKLLHIQDSCSSSGYPNSFRRDSFANDLQKEYGEISKDDLLNLDKKFSVCGRLLAKRGPFFLVKDVSGSIQFYIDKSKQAEIKEKYKELDIGDIIGATGVISKSNKGDLYINVDTFHLLTKSLRPLPEKFHGLTDQELKYRQRYVDLIINNDAQKTFMLRSKLIKFIRNFLEAKGFMEVETPMLQVIPGGATAKPFITHHNALDMDMYLRIAPELYLKRLVVGGFERVFEINRNFRNEGLSTRHNPEFTMLEFYQAYADYNDLIALTEEMLPALSQELHGSTKINYGEHELDFSGEFTKISMKDSILKYNDNIKAESLENLDDAKAVAATLGIKVDGHWGLGKVIAEIFEETVEHKLIQPTFVTEYPAEISPLARKNDQNPEITDRFELFIAGREIANGFSELNDPQDQADRFADQVNQKDSGDDEAMFFDKDYIQALEYGLPPTAGQGIGIDRLAMLFTDSSSIKDIILFPTMKLNDSKPQGSL